jgi:uncharacterized membrane protein YoaK (UPF0700 family)
VTPRHAGVPRAHKFQKRHAINGMLLIPLLAVLALLLAIFIQIGMGQTSRLAVHVPLGVAILGLIGALLGRTRNLARASTDPSAPAGSCDEDHGLRRHRPHRT